MTEAKNMTEAKEHKKSRLLPVLLFILAGILLAGSVTGFILQGTDDSRTSLSRMRSKAVVQD